MKIAFLTVGSAWLNVQQLVGGLESLGEHEITLVNLGPEIVERTRATSPDLICYSGAATDVQPTPGDAEFVALREIASCIHLCPDAGDPPWWPFIKKYRDAGYFDLTVAIDGGEGWPMQGRDFTALFPSDPRPFSNIRPHSERSIPIGFWGSWAPGDSRERALAVLGDCVTRRRREAAFIPYQEYADFMMDCRIVVNFSETGSGQRNHVKMRVGEAALAGACLMEIGPAPTHRFFDIGTEYVEISDPNAARAWLMELASRPINTQRIGYQMRDKWMLYHHPRQFWGRVFEAIQGTSTTPKCSTLTTTH